MNSKHVIPDEILEQAKIELYQNNHWFAYNNFPYFLEKSDIHFFKSGEEAIEFASNNISDYDNYSVLHINSVEDILKLIPYWKSIEQHLSNKKLSIMNEKNLEYLKDNVKYMGFGDKQNEALEQHLKEGKDSFHLTFNTEVNKKPFEAALQFRKSENSDMYFLNSYNASLQRSNGEKIEQTFYLNKGKGVTAKEAYNMLEGRAVYKELSNKAGEPYKAWIQLDFDNKDKNNNYEVKQFHENYGYDLKMALSKYAVSEMDGSEKEKALVQSLQKGNIQSVSIEKDGSNHKIFIEANPQFKSVTLYDGQMKRVQKESLEQFKSVHQSQITGRKQEQKQDVKKDLKHDVKKTPKQKVTNDLGNTQKKPSRKKGISV